MVFSYWCCRQPRMLSFAKDDHKVYPDPDPDMARLRRFSVEELQTATNDFSNDNILGRGGFGKVYRGRLEDGSMVAVKRLERHPTIVAEVQFQTTNEIINMATTHRNVLRLKGLCLTQTDRLLVYPYMTNGSLSSHLRDRRESEPAINWGTRKRIALGAAKGLCYLHDECNPKIIHRDVKAANILLDEDFEAVVGDFGLAILMDYNETHVTTDVCGTIGHIAPEYLGSGLCSDKTDVYGFGIVLLELITGQKAVDLSSIAAENDLLLLDWVKQVLKEKNTEAIADPDLQGNYVETEMEELIKIALLCTQTSPIYRPKMAQVIGMLEHGYGLGEKWLEWMEMGESNQGLKLFFQPITWYPTDSTELLSAIELSGPR